MLSAALLSMWISNTATALMLLPVALSIVELNGQRGVGKDNSFATLLLLALAYGCNIGGMATLIGTPPNAFLAGFMEQEYGYTISFVNWFVVGIPLVVVLLPIAYLILTRLYDSNETDLGPLDGSEFKVDLESAGALTREQRLVAATFLVTTLLWITRPLVAQYIPGITDAGIAMLGGLVLFVIPSDFKKNIFLLDWPTAKGLPWETLILFGGGLSLASAFTRTGLSQWFGELLSTFGSLPIFVVIAIVATTVVFLTELTSNTATAATLLPIVAALAVGIGQHPMLLAVPAALGASCAFMLPVATPPNAIVYASERVTIPQMVRAGLLVNIASIVVISMAAYTIVIWWFGLVN
jgi:sodium-dependent dicarboxylate transporter 2/3/5